MSRQTSPSTETHTPSQERPFAAERWEDSIEAKPRPPFARLGFSSAILTAVFTMLFLVGGILGMMSLLPPPWDIVIPIGASLLLAPSFVVMMVSIHYGAPFEKQIWSHIGIAFAVLYAALVSIVYVTWLFVAEPHVLRGEANQVALFTFTPGSFLQMVDGLGYTFMGIATLFAAQVFAGKRLEQWIRWLCLLNGLGALLVFLSYVSYGPLGLPFLYSLLLGVWWTFIFPALATLLAVYFRRGGDTAR
jgi:hypothetical protein